MRHFSIFLSLMLMLVSFSAADAKQVGPLCLKYISTGERYWVQSQVMYGSDLAREMGGSVPNWLKLNRLYAIVFWAPDQVTVIALEYNVAPIDAGIRGTDLDGRKWLVSNRDEVRCKTLR